MQIPGYRELSVLGRGGFSTVYRAQQESVQREVALKVLAVHLAGADAQARFRREAATNGRVGNHPNIVTMFDSGFADDGSPYLAMQLCSGGSLSERLRAAGPLPIADVLRIGVKISAALQFAHSAGVLHRDIKPENILISDFGEPELADFGISSVDDQRMSTVTASSFTINHAAPEALAGRPSSVASDVYGLCSTLFTLVAGHTPFNVPSSTAIYALVNKVMNEPAPPTGRPDVPTSLERLLASGLSKTPEGRPADAKALGSALQQIQHELGLPITEFPSAPPPLASSPTQYVAGAGNQGAGVTGVAGVGMGAVGMSALGMGAGAGGPDAGSSRIDTGALPPTGALPAGYRPFMNPLAGPSGPPVRPGGPIAGPSGPPVDPSGPPVGEWGAWAGERVANPSDADQYPAEPAHPAPLSLTSTPLRATPINSGPDRRLWWILGAIVLVLLLAGGGYLIATKSNTNSSNAGGGAASTGSLTPPISTGTATAPTKTTAGKTTPSRKTTSSSGKSTTASTTAPTTSRSTTSPAPITPSISNFGASSVPDGGSVACATPGDTVDLSMVWDTGDATKAWIGLDVGSDDASQGPYASDTPLSSSGYRIPFACSSTQHTYTLTVQSASGQKLSRHQTYRRNLAVATTPATSTTPTTTTASSTTPTTAPTTPTPSSTASTSAPTTTASSVSTATTATTTSSAAPTS